MRYDVFISYSEEDKPWAIKFRRSLENRGFAVFADFERFASGESWNQNMRNELQASLHILSLWSKNAKASHLMALEMEYFAFEVSRPGRSAGRDRLLVVDLDGNAPPLFVEYQAITDLLETGATKWG